MLIYYSSLYKKQPGFTILKSHEFQQCFVVNLQYALSAGGGVGGSTVRYIYRVKFILFSVLFAVVLQKKRIILSLLSRGEGHTEFLQWAFCPSFRGEKDILSSYSGHSVPPSEGRRTY